MKSVFKNIKVVFVVAIVVSTFSLLSCQRTPSDIQHLSELPAIFPDYIDVTIPAEIAPLNFEMEDEAVECLDITVRGNKGGELHCQGAYADFDLDEWHALTEANRGADLQVSVIALREGRWYQYQNFVIHVSSYPLDDYGLTYRLIAPGYEVGGEMGIYQRNLKTFDESAIIESPSVPGQCMNCHTANQGKADQFLFHIRGGQSGTLIQQNGQRTWLSTMTDSTRANCSYSYWHPSGHYVASSINKIYQLFYTGNERRIEVFDGMSDVLVIDTRTNQLLLNPLLQQKDWLETYPVFSPDGQTLFFCTARARHIPDELADIRYSLCRISFDAATGTYGTQVDTLLHAEHDSLSYTFPRPSYDGRWLLYDVSAFGNFPACHPESDLWLMDLRTGHSRPLQEVNSNQSDSYHSWSTNSHWIVFSSRRGDGLYNLAYLTSLDDQGRATKPFLLPQRHPRQFYADQFRSYNCPDFTHEPVNLDLLPAANQIMHGKKQQVTIK